MVTEFGLQNLLNSASKDVVLPFGLAVGYCKVGSVMVTGAWNALHSGENW